MKTIVAPKQIGTRGLKVRLEPQILDALKAEADRQFRSINNLASLYIRRGLDVEARRG